MNSVIFDTLLKIVEISHQSSLSFQEKLQGILEQVLCYMKTEKGSIMLLRGGRILEVVASTNTALIRVRQSIEEDTPSAWVVRNKRSLYVGPGGEGAVFQKRFKHYKKEAFLLAPIISRTKVIGVLSITDKHGDDAFSTEEQQALLGIASQVIGTVENERLSRSLKKSRDDIKLKNIELQKMERVRTELFNMLIHDLKGPLSEVTANLDILSYTTTGENLECVHSGQSACDTLFRMITDLLDITRLEEGCLKLLYENIDPVDLIHEAVTRLSSMAETRGIGLKEEDQAKQAEEGSTPISEPIPGDRGLLLRVLQNLIVNAVQHSPVGGDVKIGFECKDKVILFHVQDQGPGIDPKYHEAIFDKFFQITKKRDGRRFSTGLGLTFCKIAIEAHKGFIKVESDGRNGSRFVFSIPSTQEQIMRKPRKQKRRI